MKKLILIAIIISIPHTVFSQSLFDKYEDLDNVASVVVNQSMFSLLSNIDVEVDDKDTQDFMDVAKSLKDIRVFTTEDKDISNDMKVTVNKHLKSSSMEELMRVKEKYTNINFYIKKGKDDNHVSELLMFLTSINNQKNETILLSLNGDIDLNKIGSLVSKMNLPTALNKVKK